MLLGVILWISSKQIPKALLFCSVSGCLCDKERRERRGFGVHYYILYCIRVIRNAIGTVHDPYKPGT